MRIEMGQSKFMSESPDKQKGSAITDEFQSLLKSSAEQSYVFVGNDNWKNIEFIRNKIGAKYPGNWFVS